MKYPQADTSIPCSQILSKEGDAKLLLCAPQGYSADLLASALGAAGLKPTEMMRLADPRHPPVQMKDVRDARLPMCTQIIDSM